MRFERLLDRRGIDCADESRHVKSARNDMIPQAHRRRKAWDELIDEGRWVGKPCGFNDDPGEGSAQGLGGGIMKFVQGRTNIASGRTADAAGGRDHQFAIADLNEVVIQGDFAELIHDDGRVAHSGMCQKVIQ